MKTVKIRIPIAIDCKGNWVAGSQGEEHAELYLDDLEVGEARFWLEAELPIPEIPTLHPSTGSNEVDPPILSVLQVPTQAAARFKNLRVVRSVERAAPSSISRLPA